jgi:hypothetical protein
MNLLGENVKANYAPSNIKFLSSNEKVSFKINAKGVKSHKLLFIEAVNDFKEEWNIVEISVIEDNRLISLFTSKQIQQNDVNH